MMVLDQFEVPNSFLSNALALSRPLFMETPIWRTPARPVWSATIHVRMHSRRMTRLTNEFSKKMENHAHAMSLHFFYCNFVLIHKTLKTTPAMAAGVTDRLWEVSDMVAESEAREASN
jgi:hypothetical protein